MSACIFVTGATGTIGSELVPLLLGTPATRVVALIRGKDDAEVELRAAALCDRWGFAPNDPRRVQFRAVRGDVSMPGLGMAPRELDEVAAISTHIVHSAANVKLNMSAQEAAATTVAPARAILSLAREAKSRGCLQKLDWVSTVGVWGRAPGVMPEKPIALERHFHNTYEAAKAEAESVLWDEAGDVPFTVHRPSMVVGATGTGRIANFQVFYHLCEFLSGARTFGVMPQLKEQRLDTIPVDWVARVIQWSIGEPLASGRILHLCSGPDGSVRLRDLQQVVRKLWRRHRRRVPPLIRLSTPVLRGAIPVIGALAGSKARRALRALPPILAYLDEDQAFSNQSTGVLLNDARLPVPSVDAYLDDVLTYYLTNSPTGRR